MDIYYNITFPFYYFNLLVLLVVLSSCEIHQKELKNDEVQVVDSIPEWIKIAKNNKIDDQKRLEFLRKSNDQLLLRRNDSSKIKKLLRIADIYYELEEDSMFLETNENVLGLAQKLNNKEAIAEYHWNKGNLFSDKELLDSAFYEYNIAYHTYDSLNHEYYRAKMAYNMSYIHFRISNYIESEILVISAIEGYKKLNKFFNLFLCYNRLLLLDKELGNFETALDHYNDAVEFLQKSERTGIHKERLLNNLSLVYQKQQKYEDAIETLNKALLNKSLRTKHPNLYAKLIDNRAYCRFLMGDQKGVETDFNKALLIRDSLDNDAGVGISKMHLSEFYLSVGDSLQALQTAQEAHDLARTFGLNRDILSSLVLLSRADPSHATAYMNSHIKLNDSLLLEERKIRNKFTRIQFETEDYIAANKDLKKKNIWISLTSVLGVTSLSFLFFGYRQKAKNRTLLLHQQQQKANEEIYDLMLKQQNREEEGRIQERIRISEELHDGVLARLFSVRISMGFLKVTESKKEENRFPALLKELQSVEKDIRDLSHALKNDDLSSKKDFPKFLFKLLEEQSRIGNLTYTLEQESSIAWNLVDEKIKINLFRTIQEAICNILKYARCSEIKLRLERRNNSVQIYIVDDGIGFDTNKRHKGIGLKNMKSRAKSIGAKISIKSVIQEGTKIKISIPTKILYHEPTTKSTDY